MRAVCKEALRGLRQWEMELMEGWEVGVRVLRA